MDVYQKYQSHPMARSLTKAASVWDRIQSSDPVVRPPGSPWKYRIRSASGQMFHEETILDAGGGSVAQQSVPVDYAVGSGKRGMTFLVNRDGFLFASPVTWYAGRQCWDLSPGYLPAQHQRFQRRVSDGCLACHSGTVRRSEGSKDRYQSIPFLEESIGCERCHGPGRPHVDFRSSAGTHGGMEDPVLRLSKLTAERRDAICSQCHLQGEKRVLRPGRTEFDFQPGDRIDDIWIVFRKTPGLNSVAGDQAVSQVEQLMLSRCRDVEGNRLSCIHCHDPHSVPDGPSSGKVFQQKCLHCHSDSAPDCRSEKREQQGADADCVKCHMPRLPASDVPHTAQTDHRILAFASPPRPPVRNDGLDRGFGLVPEDEVRRADGLRLAELARERSDAALAFEALSILQDLTDTFRSDVEFWNAVAVAGIVAGDHATAKTSWESALSLRDDCEEALDGLCIVAFKSGDLNTAETHARHLMAINRFRPDIHARLARILLMKQNAAGAVDVAREGLKLDVGYPPLYLVMSEALQVLGQNQESVSNANIYRKLTRQRRPADP